jgi:murein L,D-transpeptidase YcbB/YkuD
MWDCNVVVGAQMNKTVIFNGDLKYVVFSPYWNVPPGILNKEVKPGIKKNPNYLKSHNMEWNGGKVRQKPGPNNSLGLVKFLFPNSYNIYLHDSPAKSLFNETTRTFSHGCVRVGEPKKREHDGRGKEDACEPAVRGACRPVGAARHKRAHH